MLELKRRTASWAWRLRVAAVTGILLGGAGIASAQSVRVEAEAYTALGSGGALSVSGGSSGIGIETRNALGKDGEQVSGSFISFFRNLGNNALQEFLEYNLNVPADGMYKIRMRAAYNAGNVTIRTWNLTNGATYDQGATTGATVDMTPSGGMLAEHMIQLDLPYEMPMKQGANRIRFYMMNRGINPDWFEFTRTGDITAYGLVTGQVTDFDTGQPIAPAMVAADVFEAAVPGTVSLYGFRAVTDDTGKYTLMLPVYSFPYSLYVGAQGYSNPTSLVANVTVSGPGTVTQDLAVFPNGRYEVEWFTSGPNSGIPNGKGFGMYDRSAGGTSWGRVVGAFESYADWMSFTVTVPQDGLYDIAVNAAPANPSLIQLSTSTGYLNRMTLAKSTTYVPYNFTAVPLKKGANTVTLTNIGPISTNMDYFTVSSTGGEYGTITGTVTNTGASAPEPGAIVTVTNGSGKVVGRSSTDASGVYTILVEPGTYTVTAGKSGFDGGAGTSVTVAANGSSTTNLNVAPSDTIVLLPEDMRAIKNGANEIPRLYGLYEWSPTGQTVGNLASDSWVEFPFYVAKPGMYTVTLDYSFGDLAAANRTLSVDVRGLESNQHFATRDAIATPTGVDFHTYVPLAMADPVPLRAGVNILRVYNSITLHATAPRPAAGSGGSVNLGRITLNRSADLPAMAPITGTVNSSSLGMPVMDAMVLANPFGSEVPEPSRFWYNGYWTTTGGDGQYSLDVPVGTYTVQAARPDNFILAGAKVENVDVTATGATANLDLPSLWTDGSIRVEAEYYAGKSPEEMGDSSGPGVAVYVNDAASNGYRLNALGSEDYIDLLVDVPAEKAGTYSVTALYNLALNNEANPGSATFQLGVNNLDVQQVSPPTTPSLTVQPGPSEFTFPNTVTLQPGRNVIRWMMVVASNTTPFFDALVLTPVQPLPMARKALAIAGGLATPSGNDMTDLNVVTTGDSASAIDILDAVALAQQGK